MNIPVVAGRRANTTQPLRRLSRRATTAATAARAATSARSSARRITCCRSPSRPASSRSGRTPSSARVLVDDERPRRRACSTSTASTGTEHQVLAKVVVMGASAVDTTRILLNSKSHAAPERDRQRLRRHRPLPLRADSRARRRIPPDARTARRSQHDRGIGGEHIYMPRLHHRLQEPAASCAATRCSSGTPAASRATCRRSARACPASARISSARSSGTTPRGSSCTRSARRCPTRTTASPWTRSQPDRYGVPMLKIDYEIGDNERKMRDHIYDTLEEVGKTRRHRVGALHARRARQRTARRSTSTAAAAWARTRSGPR